MKTAGRTATRDTGQGRTRQNKGGATLARKRGYADEQNSLTAVHDSGLATAAALGPNTFGHHNVKEAIPADWHDRARKAWEYYTEEPLVSNVINTWRIFAVGDEIRVTSTDEQVEEQALELFYNLDLNSFVKDMILQLIVKGDCIGYFQRNEAGDDLARVTCVNPISVVLKFEDGELVEAVQKKEITPGVFAAGDEGLALALDQFIHRKWNAPEYSHRGNSMVLPAFESIELLRDYRKAERAIAQRWTTPLRFVQVGGAYGQHLIKPDLATLNTISDILARADLKDGVVVPFWVNVKTYGTEGETLNTEKKVSEIKEDILVALGMARSIVSGDGPNFATASISMQKMVTMLKEIKQIARDILDWVYDEWKARKGYEKHDISYHFSDLDLHNEADMKKLLMEMYDRGLISKKTLQTKMGLDPESEDEGKEEEPIVVDTNWSVQDVTQLVALEILTPEEAREYLGLSESRDQAIEDSTEASLERRHAKYRRK